MTNTREVIQKEALDAIKPLKRSGVGISMGVGKTLIGLNHLNLVSKAIPKKFDRAHKALIVAPKKVILEGWKAEAEKFGLSHLLENVDFTTYRSLTKHALDYDVIYLDECHSLLYSHKPWLSKCTGIIVGLTGTPPAYEKSEKGKMVKEFCPIVYEYIIDEAVNDNILNDYKIIVHTLSMEPASEMLIEKGNSKWYTSEVKSYDYWTAALNNANSSKERQIKSVQRMKAMQTFPSKEDYAKKLLIQSQYKCLLFANTKEQADRLCNHSYHSGNKNSETNMDSFISGAIDKMSCVLQLSEGANIPGLKEGIIMHAYGNNRKSAQRIGRLLRLNPDDTATIHILCYKNSVDEKWVTQALSDFDSNKISWHDTEIF